MLYKSENLPSTPQHMKIEHAQSAHGTSNPRAQSVVPMTASTQPGMSLFLMDIYLIRSKNVVRNIIRSPLLSVDGNLRWRQLHSCTIRLCSVPQVTKVSHRLQSLERRRCHRQAGTLLLQHPARRSLHPGHLARRSLHPGHLARRSLLPGHLARLLFSRRPTGNFSRLWEVA